MSQIFYVADLQLQKRIELEQIFKPFARCIGSKVFRFRRR